MKSDILKTLREADDYVSGQELCETFGVSRTAVWKAINKLREEGYVIDSVSNRGYKLLKNSDKLSKNEIESRLTTKWAGKNVVCFETTGSTNNDARRMAEEGAEHGTLVTADSQEGGKGRRGRAWNSPKGVNILMTLLLRPEFPPNVASMLTLVMAQSVAEGIDQVCGVKTGIKWPNDIVLNKKKICGILTEMSTEPDYINYVVIGAGINVNNTDFPEDIKMTATSLLLETGEKFSRAELIAAIMKNFEKNYKRFLVEENLDFMLDEYNNRLVNFHANVRVLDPKGEYEGIAQGINKEGELLVTKKDGETVNVYAGEVSVRGIYGYV